MYLSKSFSFISLLLCLVFLGLSADYATNSNYLDLTSTISDLSHDSDYAPLERGSDPAKKSKNLRPLLYAESTHTDLPLPKTLPTEPTIEVSALETSFSFIHPSRAPPVSFC